MAEAEEAQTVVVLMQAAEAREVEEEAEEEVTDPKPARDAMLTVPQSDSMPKANQFAVPQEMMVPSLEAEAEENLEKAGTEDARVPLTTAMREDLEQEEGPESPPRRKTALEGSAPARLSTRRNHKRTSPPKTLSQLKRLKPQLRNPKKNPRRKSRRKRRPTSHSTKRLLLESLSTTLWEEGRTYRRIRLKPGPLSSSAETLQDYRTRK